MQLNLRITHLKFKHILEQQKLLFFLRRQKSHILNIYVKRKEKNMRTNIKFSNNILRLKRLKTLEM